MKNELATLLLVDFKNHSLAVDVLRTGAEQAASTLESLPLSLSHTVRDLKRGTRVLDLKGLATLAESGEPLYVLFGVTNDPLSPFDEKFHAALSALSIIARGNVRRLVFQTRSPLVLLALPALEQLKRCASITVALEALDDGTHRRHLPHDPLPSERIQTIRALSRMGFVVNVQLAPLLGRNSPESLAERFRLDVGEFVQQVRSVPFHRIYRGGHTGSASAQSTAKAFGFSSFSGAADKFLRALERLSPQSHVRLQGELAA